MPFPDPAARDALNVRTSPIHGVGVFAARPIADGEMVGVYGGRRYPPGSVVETALDDAVTYCFGLSDGSTIDGAEGGNDTRYINHSCEPNCEAVEERGEDDEILVKIVALEPLRAGQEVFIDYALMLDPEDEAGYECLCGAQSCRGSMAAALEPDL